MHMDHFLPWLRPSLLRIALRADAEREEWETAHPHLALAPSTLDAKSKKRKEQPAVALDNRLQLQGGAERRLGGATTAAADALLGAAGAGPSKASKSSLR